MRWSSTGMPVDRLDTWRFGLATATGLTFPDRLIDAAPPQLRAWQAASPIIAPADRLESAQIAAGLGVFSSQSLIDLHSTIYDATGPDDIPETEAWQVRLAFLGRDLDTRLGAMRRIWSGSQDYLPAAGRTSDARPRRRAGGAERRPPVGCAEPDRLHARRGLRPGTRRAGRGRSARWTTRMRTRPGRCSRSASPDGSGVDLSVASNQRLHRPRRQRGPQAQRSARRRPRRAWADRRGNGEPLERPVRPAHRQSIALDPDDRPRGAHSGRPGRCWSSPGRACRRRPSRKFRPSHVFHAIAGLRRTGQEYTARMIAAEALART